MYLADAFVQLTLYSRYLFDQFIHKNWTHDLGVASAMLYCLSFRNMSKKTKNIFIPLSFMCDWYWDENKSDGACMWRHTFTLWAYKNAKTLCPNTFKALQKVLSCFQWESLYDCVLAETHIHLTFEVESSEMFPEVLKVSKNMARVKMCSDSCLYLLRIWCSGYYWCPDVLPYFCILYKCVPFF